MNNKKSTGLLLSILGVVSLVLITAGVTYAFFSYAKEGETENTISTGTITFLYDELEGAGNGILIEDALPMTDGEGKVLAGTNKVFNFQVTSTVSGDANIPYTVTARKKADSTLAENQIKLYLEATGSETAGTNYTTSDGTTAGTVKLYSDLTNADPDVVDLPDGTVEKVLYTGKVPARSVGADGAAGYTENFTLRMWINGDTTNGGTDYSAYEFVKTTASTGKTEALKADDLIASGDFITSTEYYALDAEGRAAYERVAYVNKTARTIWTVSQAKAEGFAAGEGFVASEQFYSINGQKFTVTVNVYANATVVAAGTGDTTGA